MGDKDLLVRLARAIAPESWDEYDRGEPGVSPIASWRVIESLHAARRVLTELEAQDVR